MWGPGFEADNFVADNFVKTDIADRINNNEASIADSAYVSAFQWQLDLLEAGLYNSDILVGTYDNAIKAMVDGTAFATIMSTNTMSRYPDEANENYLSGFAMSEEGNRVYYSLPNYAYVVNEEAGGDNRKGAMAFIEWFIIEENLTEYYSSLKAPSAYIGIENEMWPYATDSKKMFEAQEPYAYMLDIGMQQIGYYSMQVIAKQKTPLEAAEEMQRDFAQNAKAAGLPEYQ